MKLRGKKESCVTVKAYFERAYDLVNRKFLFCMQQRLSFCTQWIKWIKGCLKSSTISVLVNGSPTWEFAPTKGLRQRDPLTPFLFLIVVDGLAGVVR